MTTTANKPTVWKRKRQVRVRYGDCSDRTIDRMVKAKKLPPPQYPLGNKVPFWDEAELDASDKAAAAAYRNQPAAA
jgi:predicted DNA-binding transcriptional regulator AlpA